MFGAFNRQAICIAAWKPEMFRLVMDGIMLAAGLSMFLECLLESSPG